MKTANSQAQKYAAIILKRSKHGDTPIDLFCKQHGIKRQSFYYWKNKLQKNTTSFGSSQRNFIPVHVTEPLPRATTITNLCYEIRFPNGSQIQLPSNMAIDDLTRVLHSVASIAS